MLMAMLVASQQPSDLLLTPFGVIVDMQISHCEFQNGQTHWIGDCQ